ncbi:MAG: hypothetical protein H0U74_08840 [Bradymonadaceae bacterium]|nr:hypothetical protein [Lujinxingiaceae bacterium]
MYKNASKYRCYLLIAMLIMTIAACIPNPDAVDFQYAADGGNDDTTLVPGDVADTSSEADLGADAPGDVVMLDADSDSDSDARDGEGDGETDARDGESDVPDMFVCEDNNCGPGGQCIDNACDPVVNVGVGHRHSCAVRGEGSVVCWGSNDSMQLASNSLTTTAAPVLVAGLPAADSVGGGVTHSCALTKDQRVFCWGTGGFSELGQFSTGETVSHTPLQVLFSDDEVPDEANSRLIVQLGVGSHYNCALDVDGKIWCWGRNQGGTLGINNATTMSARPLRVDLAEKATSIAVAVRHVCAIMESTNVLCWGSNANNLISDTEPANSIMGPTPRGVLAQKIWAGAYNGCVLTPNSEFQCWGRNDVKMVPGFLGNTVNVPTKIDSVSDVVDAAIGLAHICVIQSDGAVMCWGNNLRMVVGVALPTNESNFAPVDVALGNDGEKASRIAADHYHSCASTDRGRVYCWGSNDNTQLGVTPRSGSSSPVKSALLLPFEPYVLGVGTQHGCAHGHLGASSELRCWGRNDRGQAKPAGDPRSALVVHDVDLARQAKHLAFGSGFGCAGSENGLYCWGANDRSQLGGAGNTTLNDAIKVQQLAAGNEHACARVGPESLGEGQVWCWGRSNLGQAGLAGGNQATPKQIGNFAQVTSVAAGNNHTCIVDNNSVYCWGNNASGQLGNGSIGGSSHVPNAVTGLGHVSAVFAGNDATCAVADNAMMCWGRNIGGLSNNTTNSSPVEFALALPSFFQISLGANYSCALDLQSQVWCWGSNEWGQLGQGNFRFSATPTQIQGIPEMRAISAGQDFACAVELNSGDLYCWGNGDFGQLAGLPMAPTGPQRVTNLP